MLPPYLFYSYLNQIHHSLRAGGPPDWDPVRARNGGKPLGIALVGLGDYSESVLAPGLALTQHCKLSGIVTGTASKIPRWQARYAIPDKNVYSYETFDRIVDNPDIDVVYIVTPNYSHAALTLRAAAAGKHVWCEKPMAMTSIEAQQMIDACRQHRVGLSIAYRLQHEPNLRSLQDVVRQRALGALQRLTLKVGHDLFHDISPNNRSWRLRAKHGGGAMFDMGVYTLNTARFIAQKEPIAVSARQWTQRPDLFDEVDEFLAYTLEFADNVTAECETSFGKEMNALRVDCENGWYAFEPYQVYQGIQGRSSDGRIFNARYTHMQAMQIDNDALALLNGTPLIVPGEDGLQDMRVIEAIHGSIRENGRRIEI